MKTFLRKTLVAIICSTALITAQAQTPQMASYTEADKERILNKANYPLYKSDLKKAEQLAEMYGNSFYLDDDSWKRVEAIKSSRDTLERIGKAYTELWKVYLNDAGKKEPLQELHDNALYRIKKLEQSIKDDYQYKSIDISAKSNLTEALELAEKKNEVFTNQPYKSGGDEFDWKYIDKRLNMGLAYFSIFKLIHGTEHPKFAELEKKKESTIAKIEPYKTQFFNKINELEMNIVAGTRLPKEKYMGADKEQLRKKIIAANSSCTRYKLAKVIFPDQNWERNVGWEYSEIRKADEKYDYNVLGIDIVIYDPKQPEIGYLIQGLSINRNNLTKVFEYDISVSFICPDNVNELHEVSKILMKHVK